MVPWAVSGTPSAGADVICFSDGGICRSVGTHLAITHFERSTDGSSHGLATVIAVHRVAFVLSFAVLIAL